MFSGVKSTQGVVATVVAASIMFTGFGFAAAPANAAPSNSGSQSGSAEEVTPEDLPVRSIADVRAEASAKGLDDDATETAVELQKVVNAYHELPEDMKGRPTSDPEVEAALQRQMASSGTAFRGPVDAMDCALAVADAASIAVPGANAWKWVKAAGGVITFADAIQEYLQSKSEDALVRALGKTAGNELKKVLGIQGVKDSCLS